MFHDLILERGDAYVAVTAQTIGGAPTSVDKLKELDPERYEPLAWPSRSAASYEPDIGFLHDMLSQLGALLKDPQAPSNPLRGASASLRLYLTGVSMTGGQTLTYQHTFGSRARLADGGRIYDGYLVNVSNQQLAINRDDYSTAPEHGLTTITGYVPTIVVKSESELNTMIPLALARRTDSDSPEDRFRLYEVPATIHYGTTCPAWQYVSRCAYANLDRWVRAAVAPPVADRLQVRNPDQPDPNTPCFRWGELLVDDLGNTRGGVRHPWVEAPDAVYLSNQLPTPNDFSPRLGYFLGGSRIPLDETTLRRLYGSHDGYVAAVARAARRMVDDRFLLPSDAEAIIEDARASDVLSDDSASHAPVGPPAWRPPRGRDDGWYSAREAAGYPDPIDYLAPPLTLTFVLEPSLAVTAFWTLPGFQLDVIPDVETDEPEHLLDAMRDRFFHTVQWQGYEEHTSGTMALADGQVVPWLEATALYAPGGPATTNPPTPRGTLAFDWTLKAVARCVGDRAYILVAYDHSRLFESRRSLLERVVETFHETN